MPHALRVGIVGAGVAGLAAAILLGRQGHRVSLIERAPALGPVGAGLLLHPSGQRALAAMGLLEAVIARAEPIASIHARTHHGRTLVRLEYSRLGSAVCGYGVHRGDLFSVLYQEAQNQGVCFTLKTTVVSSRQSTDHIFAHDAGGATHGPFDLLIAADGSRSRLRGSCMPRAIAREFPLGAAWFSGRSAQPRHELRQVTRGTRQLIGLLPLGDGRCSLFCAMPRSGKESLAGEGLANLKRQIVSLCPDAAELVRQIERPEQLACTTYTIASLPRWDAGRLIFLGDAAHSTTPHLGQGVNLALLDAQAMAGALADCSPSDVPTALHHAAALRRRHVMWSWRLSNAMGPLFQDDGRLLGIARDAVLPWLPGIPLLGKLMVETMAGTKTGLFRRLPRAGGER